MGVLNLVVTSGVDDATLTQMFEQVTGNHVIMQRLLNFFGAINGGAAPNPRSIGISIDGNAVYASGTFTLTSVVATDICSINGVAFTCVAGAPAANQFQVGADDDATAVNLAAAINASASALVDGYVVAEAEGDVVTVTSAFAGVAGNQTLIASADATIVASGARLAGGAVDPNAITVTF